MFLVVLPRLLLHEMPHRQICSQAVHVRLIHSIHSGIRPGREQTRSLPFSRMLQRSLSAQAVAVQPVAVAIKVPTQQPNKYYFYSYTVPPLPSVSCLGIAANTYTLRPPASDLASA